MNLPDVGISSPWVQYCKKLNALFEKDEQIIIVLNLDEPIVKIYVDNQEKLEALRTFIPEEKIFGNVTLKISLIPNNKAPTTLDRIRKLFYGNPIVKGIYEIKDISSNSFIYVEFSKEVVQYFDDNLADLNGNTSTLYQYLAMDVLENHDGIFFYTSNNDGTVPAEEVQDINERQA